MNVCANGGPANLIVPAPGGGSSGRLAAHRRCVPLPRSEFHATMDRVARSYNGLGEVLLGVLMPIRFRCTACGGVLSIARRKAGSSILCPKCAVGVVVPGASTVPDPDRTEAPVRSAVAGEPVIAGRPVAANGAHVK